MKFYYENCMGDYGFFSEKDLIKAIYTAWNIEAELWLVSDVKTNNHKLVFSPSEDNEFNSELLHEYGYYMADGQKYREIRRLKDNKVVKYDWSEVKQLV